MSLDVYLEDPTAKYETESLYWANITHNLGEMAEKAGIYKALWRPEEIGAKYAKDIIEINFCDGSPTDFEKLSIEQLKKIHDNVNKCVDWVNS